MTITQKHLPEIGTEIGKGEVQWNLSDIYNDQLLFWADVLQGVTGLWVQLWGGDADLWVKKVASQRVMITIVFNQMLAIKKLVQ